MSPLSFNNMTKKQKDRTNENRRRAYTIRANQRKTSHSIYNVRATNSSHNQEHPLNIYTNTHHPIVHASSSIPHYPAMLIHVPPVNDVPNTISVAPSATTATNSHRNNNSTNHVLTNPTLDSIKSNQEHTNVIPLATVPTTIIPDNSIVQNLTNNTSAIVPYHDNNLLSRTPTHALQNDIHPVSTNFYESCPTFNNKHTKQILKTTDDDIYNTLTSTKNLPRIDGMVSLLQEHITTTTTSVRTSFITAKEVLLSNSLDEFSNRDTTVEFESTNTISTDNFKAHESICYNKTKDKENKKKTYSQRKINPFDVYSSDTTTNSIQNDKINDDDWNLEAYALTIACENMNKKNKAKKQKLDD